MSYILDALRRAEAERQRGQAPGVQQVTAVLERPAADGGGTRKRAPWIVAAVGLVLLAGGFVGWMRPGAPGPTVATHDRAEPTAPAPKASASATVAPPPARAAAPSSPQAVLPPRPVPAPRVASSPAAPRLPAATAVPAPAPAAAASTAAAATPASAAAPVAPTALPEPQRSTVQRLAFGGGVHSADRAQSFVLLAGQIVREGETVADGVVVERILPRAVVLRVQTAAGAVRVERPL